MTVATSTNSSFFMLASDADDFRQLPWQLAGPDVESHLLFLWVRLGVDQYQQTGLSGTPLWASVLSSIQIQVGISLI